MCVCAGVDSTVHASQYVRVCVWSVVECVYECVVRVCWCGAFACMCQYLCVCVRVRVRVCVRVYLDGGCARVSGAMCVCERVLH